LQRHRLLALLRRRSYGIAIALLAGERITSLIWLNLAARSAKGREGSKCTRRAAPLVGSVSKVQRPFGSLQHHLIAGRPVVGNVGGGRFIRDQRVPKSTVGSEHSSRACKWRPNRTRARSHPWHVLDRVILAEEI